MNKHAKYLIRLDDASAFMDYEKWNPYFEIFDEFSIKPIIAVIPFNKDPEMINKNPDPGFWENVRNWQKKGYHIALHGYEHLYSTKKSGLIGKNKRSEFAGVLIEKQKDMLEKGYKKFKEEGIDTKIFIAPAHSFDKKTLKALKEITNIEYISDGYFLNPVCMSGFKWIPQQLWKPKIKKLGVWTICYHPEILGKNHFELLKSFILNNSDQFINLLHLSFRNRISANDYIFKYYFLLKMNVGKIYYSIITKKTKK